MILYKQVQEHIINFFYLLLALDSILFIIGTYTMRQVLKNWTKIYFFNLQFPNALKIAKFNLQLHVRRCHDQHQLDPQMNNVRIHSSWHREHRTYSNIFKNLTSANIKENKNYIGDSIIKMLAQTFNMTLQNYEKIAKMKQFEFCSDVHFVKRATFLKEMNVTSDLLIRAPWLLWINKEELEMKVALLRQPFLFKTSQDGLGFTLFQPSLINLYNAKFKMEKGEFRPYKNRIYYLGERLKLPIDLLTPKLVHAWNLLHLRKKNIDKMTDLLLEFEILPMDIVNDIWIFLHNSDVIRVRLSKMKEAAVRPLKPWLGRCTDYNFQRALAKERPSFRESHLEVLQEKLSFSEEEGMAYIRRGALEPLTSRNIACKIRIYEEAGVNLDVIRNSPYLLRYSETRILERLKILQDRGLNFHGYVLKLSPAEFNSFLNSPTEKMPGK